MSIFILFESDEGLFEGAFSLWVSLSPTVWKVSKCGFFFLVRVFWDLNWIRENTEQKKLRIWTLFSQCPFAALQKKLCRVFWDFRKCLRHCKAVWRNFRLKIFSMLRFGMNWLNYIVPIALIRQNQSNACIIPKRFSDMKLSLSGCFKEFNTCMMLFSRN